MKKRKVKSLSLNKSKVSNFEVVTGGRPTTSFYFSECYYNCDPSKVSFCVSCGPGCNPTNSLAC
ncbi:hypothetical protein [Kordia sp.]|uniref:hypothetical protein n=1 Tax=Kordia sp. TaxID=1965332 RepID=UPI003B59FBD7